jgi:hypothetical protein
VNFLRQDLLASAITPNIAGFSTDWLDLLSDFPKLNSDVLARSTVENLFRNHGVEEILCLQLPHEYDNPYNGEKLTNIQVTSTPLDFGIGANPSIWRIDPGTQQLVSLENPLDAGEVSWDALKMQRLLEDLHNTIVKEGVAGSFRVCLTQGTAIPVVSSSVSVGVTSI